jgi:hypothetical protein
MRAGLRNIRLVSWVGVAMTLGVVSSFSLAERSAWLQQCGGEKSHIVIALTIILHLIGSVVHSARRVLAELPFHGRCRVNALGGLSHYLDAIARIAK